MEQWKKPVQGLGSWMVYMLAASLRFVLVSQFVGEHRGCSKKSGLAPKASPAAAELLNVTPIFQPPGRGESVNRGEEGELKKDKMKERNRETVTETDKEGEEGEGADGGMTKKIDKGVKSRERLRVKKYSCMLILVSRGALSNVRKGYWAEELGAVKGLDMFAIQSEAQTTTGRPEVGQFTGILQQCPGFFFAAMFTVGTKKGKKEKKNKVFFCQTRVVRRILFPTLIFPALVAKSVGTAFRASSGGGRATLTYRPALTTHIFMPDVATCQTHSAFKTSIDSNKPIYIFTPPPVVKLHEQKWYLHNNAVLN